VGVGLSVRCEGLPYYGAAMIHFVTGKPGAGKSKYLCALIVRHLNQSSGGVCTNLPIRLEPWVLGRVPQRGLLSVWAEWYPGVEFPASRLRLLGPSEVREFYRWRYVEGAVRMPDGGWVAGDGGFVDVAFDYRRSKGSMGMLYVIDECWREWGSREWAQRKGDKFLEYAPVHRHLGDEVFLATQQRDQVDVALRRLAQDFQEVRNYKWEKCLTFFRSRPRTKVVVCQDENMRVVTENRSVRYRAELQECYDTTGGVGLAGSASAGDAGVKASGLPWWLIPIGCVVVFALALSVPRMVMGGAMAFAGTTQVKRVAGPAVAVRATNQTVAVPVSQVQRSTVVQAQRSTVLLTNAVVTGWSQDRGGLRVWLADGRVFRSSDCVIVRVRDSFLIGTERFEIPGYLR